MVLSQGTFSTWCFSGLVALTFWKNKDGQFAFVLDVFCEPKQKSVKN